MSTRENYFDKMISSYFDRLWANEAYLDAMGGLLKQSFNMRKQWNKQLEQFWELWQLPNQAMQQRTLHGVNTLLSEWRFEQEEVNERLDRMEQNIAELREIMAAQASAAKPAAKASKAPADEGNKG